MARSVSAPGSTSSRSASAPSTRSRPPHFRPGNLKTLATGPRWPAFGQLVGRLSRIRGYGDFLHYHLLASGRIDAVVESDVNILDVGACAVIVEAAGGRFTDLEGRPLSLTSGSVLASNGLLHAQVHAAIHA